jgi:DNA modification methylase
MTPINKIVHGLAGDVLPSFDDKSVHCVVTSPPYYAMRRYGNCDAIFPAGEYVPLTGASPIAYPEWSGELGLEPTVEMFVGHIVAIFAEIRRVLRNDGTCWVNFGDSYNGSGKAGMNPEYQERHFNFSKKEKSERMGVPTRIAGLKPKDLIGIPWRVALAMQAEGWYLRCDNIWSKNNVLPESTKDRPTRQHEYFFLFSKSKNYFYDAEAVKEKVTGNAHAGRKDFQMSTKYRDDFGGFNRRGKSMNDHYRPEMRNKRSVWNVPAQGLAGAHFATFPPSLIEPCILAGTSAYGCCAQCAAPYKRGIIRTDEVADSHNGSRFDTGRTGMVKMDGKSAPKSGLRFKSVPGDWKPTCKCECDDVSRCIVIDPFMGSGTTAETALLHGRDFVGIEPNEEYLQMAEKRIQPLLNTLFT